MDFLIAIRWKNILLIAIAQLLTIYTYGEFSTENIILVLCTVLIASIGNIENDILDYDLDRQYKKKKNNRIIEWCRIENRFQQLSISIILICIFLSGLIYIEYSIYFLVIYLSLKLYNFYLKKTAFIGNLVVAILCSLTLLILDVKFQYSFALLTSIIFTLTLLREIVKDKEDNMFDAHFQYQTLAIILSDVQLKFIIYLLIISSIVLEYIYFYPKNYFLIVILILNIISTFFLYKNLWRELSIIIKIHIALGVVSIPFIHSLYK